MNILMLTRLYHPHVGGVERHVREVSKRLVKEEHKVVIVTEDYTDKLSEKETYLGTSIIRIKLFGYPNWLKKFRIWWWFWKNRKLIKEADIIHAHDVAFWYFPFRFIYPKKPFFVTFHGYEGNKIPTKKAKLIRKLSEVLALGNICVGDFMKKWYKTRADYVIYGGVNLPKKNILISKKIKKAVFIGRLNYDIGILDYIKGLGLAKKKGLNISLDVFGDGPLMKLAKNLAKKVNVRSRFFGWVEDASKRLLDYDLAFVSRYLAILEAAVAKRPIFAHYNNEIKRDYLEMMPIADSIMIFSKPEQLQKMIKDWKEKAELKNKVNRANVWARRQTWEKVVEIYKKLWKR